MFVTFDFAVVSDASVAKTSMRR